MNAKPISILPSREKTYFNFGFLYTNIAIPAGQNNLTISTFNYSFPFNVYFRQVTITGTYIATGGGLAKQSPQCFFFSRFGATNTGCNSFPPAYTLGANEIERNAVDVTGILNNVRMEYIPQIPFYIPANTACSVDGRLDFFVATALNDEITLSFRYIFETE